MICPHNIKQLMRIEQIAIKNYRSFHHAVFEDLPPMVVVVGANGTGKSTLLDVFSFLKDALTQNSPWRWPSQAVDLAIAWQSSRLDIEGAYCLTADRAVSVFDSRPYLVQIIAKERYKWPNYLKRY